MPGDGSGELNRRPLEDQVQNQGEENLRQPHHRDPSRVAGRERARDADLPQRGGQSDGKQRDQCHRPWLAAVQVRPYCRAAPGGFENEKRGHARIVNDDRPGVDALEAVQAEHGDGVGLLPSSDKATAKVAYSPPLAEPAWKCGDWISTTPATPNPAASQTDNVGLMRKRGQDRNATQIGNVFVSVSTSDVFR